MARTIKIEGSGSASGFEAYATVRFVDNEEYAQCVTLDFGGPIDTSFLGEIELLNFSFDGMLYTTVGETDMLRVAREDYPVFLEEKLKWETTN